MKLCITIVCLFLVSAFRTVNAQNTKHGNQLIEDLVEEIAQNNENELDYSQITDNLYYYLNTPLNLNTATTDELENLYILNDFQIRSLQNYLDKNGTMLTIYELQLIEGFDYATIKKVLPFVQVSSADKTEAYKLLNALKYGKHQIYGRYSSTVETPEGYKPVSDSLINAKPESYYPGSRPRIYSRYKFNYNNKLQWGITAEKDPGEAFFKEPQSKGFDFYSAHLQVNNIGILNTALLGDFQAQFGQGLIMWSYMSSGKSSYVMDIKKRGKGLHRYSSTDENMFFRGCGFTLEKHGVSFSTFASHKAIDANLQTDTLENTNYFSAFQNTGIHATPNQIEDKDAIMETVYGANLSWNKRNFKTGISGIQYRFSESLVTDETPKNKLRFSGNSGSNLSADMELRFKRLHLFSEAALSKNLAKAFLSGAIMELNSRFRTSILYRNYQQNYQSLYGNAFAEGSGTTNEEGLYFGAEILPYKKWKISAYYDMYKFPWLTYNTSSPSSGNDYLIQCDFTVSRNLSMYWRYKNELKQKDANSANDIIPELTQVRNQQLRYQVVYSSLNQWQFKNRLELSFYKNAPESSETGYLLYQDAIYRPTALPLSLTMRYAIFDTENYNTRIYTYENDVLYAYSIPALYDKGTRAYIMLQYSIADRLDIWLRFAQTWYAYKSEIGSGSDAIKGNKKSEIKLQIRWKI